MAAAANLPEKSFQVLNFHAGLTRKEIIEKIESCEDWARRSGKPVWCFLDEVNTSEHIGLVGELVTRRVLVGRPVHPDVAFICACSTPLQFEATRAHVILPPKVMHTKQLDDLDHVRGVPHAHVRFTPLQIRTDCVTTKSTRQLASRWPSYGRKILQPRRIRCAT
eukprot:5621753-Prymnesium_polylepis.2